MPGPGDEAFVAKMTEGAPDIDDPGGHLSAWLDRAVFGDHVVFDAPRAALLLHPEMLHRPLALANPVTARLAEEQCRALLAGRPAGSSTTRALRQALESITMEVGDAL